MKNRLVNLNDHLFSALERLNEEGLDEEKIRIEIDRSKSVSDVAGKIIDLAKTSLEAEKLKYDYLGAGARLPVYFDEKPALENKNAN